MADTVTANGDGFVVLGSATRETLYVSTLPRSCLFQSVNEEPDDDVAEPEALKKQ